MMRSNIVIGIAVAVLTFSLWAYFNQPEHEPAWPNRVQGFSYSPMQADQSPLYRQYPSEAQIDADMALLSGRTHAIRTYSLEDEAFTRIPELARKHQINVTLGAWLDKNYQRNEEEIVTLLELVRNSSNVVRVIVGNEVLLRKDLSIAELTGYIDGVRGLLKVPVSTAEPWHIWEKYPALAEHVDFIAVHMLPYWEGLSVNEAVEHIVDRINHLRKLFPNKQIVIAEVGWPSNGRTRQRAVASVANQAAFLRRFLYQAQKENYIYYIMEAFDQPWKREIESAVGAYWGVFNVERQAKFPFTEPIVPIPRWYLLAALSVIIAGITTAFLLLDSQTLRHRGRSFLAVVAFTAATGAVWIIYGYLHQYLTWATVLVGLLLLIGMIGVILVLLAEAHEWAEALWVKNRRRAFQPRQLPDERLPMVSIHVPAYNEPPAMLIETLNALAALDYPDFEVLVIDNNTPNEEVWRPVADHCRRLGARFRFFHVARLAGFKAGALNWALRHTAPQAQIIAVIDSDYVVDPLWLRDLVPQFEDPDIGLVQAPQDYRDDDQNAFKAMCFAEYRAFFYIGMVTRNERNAIIQHGTMTLVRRTTLAALGGWGEWCITEDAELGLRIFESGSSSIYIPKSYGKGLMPDNFQDYKKQRFRWAYGAIQILRRHRRMFWSAKTSRLKPGQRYHFVAGWLPWIADGVNLIFTLAALGWSTAIIIFPQKVDPPLLELSILPLALFSFKAIKMVYLYRTNIHTSIARTIAAGLAGLALTHTIAKAVIYGFCTRNMPFFRTPKQSAKTAVWQAVVSSWQEWLLVAALIAAGVGVGVRSTAATLDLRVWILVLLMQAIPYLAGVVVSLISAYPRLPARLAG